MGNANHFVAPRTMDRAARFFCQQQIDLKTRFEPAKVPQDKGRKELHYNQNLHDPVYLSVDWLDNASCPVTDFGATDFMKTCTERFGALIHSCKVFLFPQNFLELTDSQAIQTTPKASTSGSKVALSLVIASNGPSNVTLSRKILPMIRTSGVRRMLRVRKTQNVQKFAISTGNLFARRHRSSQIRGGVVVILRTAFWDFARQIMALERILQRPP